MFSKPFSNRLQFTTFTLTAALFAFYLVSSQQAKASDRPIPALSFWSYWEADNKNQCRRRLFDRLTALAKMSLQNSRNWKDWGKNGHRFTLGKRSIKIACLTQKKIRKKTHSLIVITIAGYSYRTNTILMNDLISAICGSKCKQLTIPKSKPANKSKPSGGGGGKCDNVGRPC